MDIIRWLSGMDSLSAWLFWCVSGVCYGRGGFASLSLLLRAVVMYLDSHPPRCPYRRPYLDASSLAIAVKLTVV